LRVIKQSAKGFGDDKVAKLGGSLAYFTVFSLGPMLMVIIFFADLFYGRAAIEGTIYGQIEGFVGPAAAVQIQEIIKNASLSGKSNVTAIIGFVTLFIGATGVFAEIQDTINFIWNLKPKPKKNWRKVLVDRLLSFSVVVSLGFLLLVSLLVTAVVEALSGRLHQIFPSATVTLVYVINLLITFGITTLLFAIIFKVLPDALIKWRDVLTGAMVTAVLFMIGKFAITFYVGTSNMGTSYGAAGSLVVILIWIYYSSLILYFGAEFTKAYAAEYGSPILPKKHTVWVKLVEIETGQGSLKEHEAQKEQDNKLSDETVTVK
jgi:membrane protein